MSGFNPSVGILFCRTTHTGWREHDRERFNPSVGILFCRTIDGRAALMSTGLVSIPRSGFCFVEHSITVAAWGQWQSFNPSVGILFCRTNEIVAEMREFFVVSIPRSGFCFVELLSRAAIFTQLREFQSLGRDSVLSNSPW